MKFKIFGIIFFLFFISLNAQDTATKKLTVEDIYTNPAFVSRGLTELKWFENGKKFSYLKMDKEINKVSVYCFDTETEKETVLVSGADLKLENGDSFAIQNYDYSPNERYILFTGLLTARTIKSGGTFYIYDLKEKKFFTAAQSEEEQVNAQFSPDGTKLGFVRGNNLFVYDIALQKEKQLTFDGSETVLNGVFDWVYEEEFSIIKAWEWSPDSKTIAFWRLDQSNVPQIQIAKWDSLYFNFINMHYPKPGAPNSLVKIGVVDINSAATKWMDIGQDTDIYIPRIKFSPDPGILAIQRLNRLQNKLELLFADTKTGSTKTILTDADSQWVDVTDNFTFLNSSKKFIWSSERDGYLHLYFYDSTGRLLNQITKGNFAVDEINSINEKENKLYYTSNERGILYKDLYEINFDGTGKKKITEKAGTHKIYMADDGKYYIDSYSNSVQLLVTSLYDADGKLIKDFKNPGMVFIKDYNITPVVFSQLTTTDGVKLNYSVIKPADFDSTKKYPVLINQYSGPGSQEVLDKWGNYDFLWFQLLAQHGYIVVTIDPRGTGGRGKDFQDIVYKQLGKWEVNDMIEGAKYLASLPYVDGKRIGIWGWSYGGYMSALTILKGADYFKAAVSVAPVTDWRFYDNIYTERFMQTPALNPEGYDESSTLTYAGNLKGNLLLIHGTADDNVHFQNTVKLADKLVALNKPFQTMFYPEKEHSIYGGLTRIHLFNLITKFILENL